MTSDSKTGSLHTDHAAWPRRATGSVAASSPGGVRAAGHVSWSGSQSRATVVKALSQHGEVKFAVALADGAFAFENLTPGVWSFAALHEQANPVVLHQQDIQHDRDDLDLVLRRLGGTLDESLGQRFFRIVSVVLVALTLVYVALHWLYPPAAEPISPTLAALIAQAQHQLTEADQPSQSVDLGATVAEVRRTMTAVFADDRRALSPSDQQDLNALLGRVETSIKQNQKAEALAGLNALNSRFAALAPKGFFWVREPWRFLEVLLWGVAGVLINQIVTSARYLRFGSFFSEGIVLNVAQLITIPIVALVAVLFLSLITLKVTIASSEVQLDLGDPRILAGVSFLIGLNFWSTWDFIQNISGRVTGSERREPTARRSAPEDDKT